MSPASKQPKGAKAGGETTTCPWCSATVPVEASTCVSCGASLRDAATGDVLGVTQVDPSATTRTRRVRSRNIAAFLGVGDSPDEEDALGGKIEEPSAEVRREMLRLRLAAMDAEIEAKQKEAAAQRALAPDGTVRADAITRDDPPDESAGGSRSDPG